MKKNIDNNMFISEALNEKEYYELSHDIIFRNDTSGISYLKHQSITINELRDDSICLSIPKNLCQKGHNLTIVLFTVALKNNILKFPPPDSNDSITIIGKVLNLFDKCKDTVLIEIKFTQYKPIEWQKILDLYTNKQQKISSLIQEVKK